MILFGIIIIILFRKAVLYHIGNNRPLSVQCPQLVTSSKCPPATSPSVLRNQWRGVLGLPLDGHTTHSGFLWFDASLTVNLQFHFSKSKENKIGTSASKCPENTVYPLLSFPFH